jgi:hypothetical protein
VPVPFVEKLKFRQFYFYHRQVSSMMAVKLLADCFVFLRCGGLVAQGFSELTRASLKLSRFNCYSIALYQPMYHLLASISFMSRWTLLAQRELVVIPRAT